MGCLNQPLPCGLLYHLHGQTDRLTDWVNGNQNSRLVNFVHESRLQFAQMGSTYRNTAAKVKDGNKNFRLEHSDRENRTTFSMFRCSGKFSAESTLAYMNRRYFFAFFKRARSVSRLPRRGCLVFLARFALAFTRLGENCENITPVMKARTTQKVVFHLLSNRVFWKLFVNGKPLRSLFFLEQEKETGRTRTPGLFVRYFSKVFAFIRGTHRRFPPKYIENTF